MKKVLFLLAVIAVSFAGYGQTVTPTVAPPAPKVDPASLAAFAWVSTTHDFGKIKLGVPVTHEFKFTNTGKIPLIITNVQASCGCTTPSWTKDPVMPGGSGFIKATFNAASPGVFGKTVTVTANVDPGFVQLS